MFGLSQADGLSGPALTAAALLASAAITAVAAVVIIGFLQFNCGSVNGRYERSDVIMSWVSLFLFDIAMLEAIAGVLLWYTNNFPNELIVLFASEILVLLIILTVLSLWARRKIKTLVAMCCLDDDEAEGPYYDQVHDREDGLGITRENRFSRSTEPRRVRNRVICK
ncbi:uncharacterized protein FPOAC1_013873 [Fusarium poae]|uniref:Uncharacterized protein n=1 Tax=Fusarium poae TaxID=36050 RepID=A0A1B8A7Z5_FUSPO|nr:uncharacterized protein FPOAC1_013831 [Fusarium poae]XP_044701037.1 uncharacterized protein FPOAC1_013873 [Fusarium poae]KAG8664492.1 hypothetical protein FPOAC1_013831 [Fusarium poae]KAG8664534.1 hypothetical protein FPOAC1_013873 [Fusarium poae]OBS16562.1 hypothetical protein FPOA_12803 [Fusarium poae]OBS16578.1 hypothetical protein FPOA_12796 [Fusarium poae]